ncbi:MAG TPA: LysM peptidoglycan-binding domain-containing protein, partial [Burkholderiaceae bacterium]|nr:LysM peptidoglycan-binding domain-containing protein [Burkholderiaceae bacterium]
FLSVPIERDIDVDLAARLAGMKTDDFKLLNPQMNKPMILAAATPQVLLPYDNANAFVRNLKGYRGRLSSWTAWVAPKTVRPGEAARQLGVNEGQLREINSIPARMLVKAGSTLVVPRTAHLSEDVSEEIADNATIQLAPDLPPVKRVTLKASRHGDTVTAVARRYRVSAAQVAQWNKVAVGARFKPGQIISVFVPAGSALAAAKQPQAIRPQVVVTPAGRPQVAAAPARVARPSVMAKTVRRSIVAKPAAKHIAPQRSVVATHRQAARATVASR